jgi:hypothetical protein
MKRSMRKSKTLYMVVLSLVVGMFIMPYNAQSQYKNSWNDCVEIYDRQPGVYCGSTDGVSIRFRNGCSEKIDTKVCLQVSNGTWDCGVSFLMPGESSSYYACHSNGRVKYWARRAGIDARFGEP